MHRSTLASLLAAALLAAGAGSAFADPPTPANPAGPELGVVPVHGQASKHGGGSSNLTYHGGPVLHANTTYAIYWGTFQTGYQSVMNGFLSNVATATSLGATSNVYFADTQYYDGAGTIGNASTFADSYQDQDAMPASGCRDSYTSICLSDAQLQQEIRQVATARGWALGANTIVFMFTGQNVGSCFGSSCAYSYYCAYHGNLDNSSIPYANMPYAAFVSSACGSGQKPNGNDADSTINVTSHEHNESITDPLGSAWYDQRGQEDGDKCAWNFGTSTGPSGARYNQTINGAHYYLQQEWSNHSSGCVLTGL